MTLWDDFLRGVGTAMDYTSPIGLITKGLQAVGDPYQIGTNIQDVRHGVMTMIPGEAGKIARHVNASTKSSTTSRASPQRRRKRRGTRPKRSGNYARRF